MLFDVIQLNFYHSLEPLGEDFFYLGAPTILELEIWFQMAEI